MRLARAQRVKDMGRKHADARKEQERNNDIHDATCLFDATLDAATFPEFFVWSRNGFVETGRARPQLALAS